MTLLGILMLTSASHPAKAASPSERRPSGNSTLASLWHSLKAEIPIDVTLAGAELHVRIRDARRRVSLPASLEGRPIERADLRAPR